MPDEQDELLADLVEDPKEMALKPAIDNENIIPERGEDTLVLTAEPEGDTDKTEEEPA